MKCGIYMIQNKVNNKIYIGQAVNIKKRWKQHKDELNGKYKKNEHFLSAWNKYGEENFEFTILCECEENQLNTLEEYYIFTLESYDRRVGYNKQYGGQTNKPTKEAKERMSRNNARYWLGKNMSEEHKKKLSESLKGEKNPMYGKKFSEEYRQKISKGNKGKTVSEEAREKISKGNKGKTVSEEVKIKISNSRKGIKFSEEHKKKLSESHKGQKVNGKPILCVELNKIFDSATEAERELGIRQSNICSCCKGKKKTAGGYHWKYI